MKRGVYLAVVVVETDVFVNVLFDEEFEFGIEVVAFLEDLDFLEKLGVV